ncbi:GNAT family N-acetyltransferase [Mycoplasmatota bacterium WC30]
MIISKPTQEEFNEWLDISTNVQADDRAFTNDSNPETELMKLKQFIPMILPDGQNTSGHYFNILSTDEIHNIGFIWFGSFPGLDEETIILLDIMLKEQYRSCGYGRKLLKQMQNVMREKGYKKIFLSVLKKNFALKLYESLGYKIINEKPKYQEMILDLTEL